MLNLRRLVPLIGLGSLFAAFSFINLGEQNFEVNKNLRLFTDLYRELNAMFVDNLDHNRLVADGINAMLGSLDPYTVYYPEEDQEGYKMQITGKYGGIGAVIQKMDDYIIIAEPYDGFPAAKAGLLAGDIIVAVNGKPIKSGDTDQVSENLRGAPGTTITLTIRRAGQPQDMTVTLVREEVEIGSIPYYGMIENDIAYVRLTNFTENCAEDVRNALEELKAKNAINGIVLDLRDNPGGLLDEAVGMSALFLNKGAKVVNTKGRQSEWESNYNTRENPFSTDLPLAVIISRGSASASEIVAGTIQDYDRGVIIGEKSFGKGLVQSTKGLGYNAQMKITNAKYYLPSGRCIQAIDYSGKYKDGTEEHVPDSLRTAYKTQKGRKVFDAGGIDPDLKVEVGMLADITAGLYTKQLIFQYATLYTQKHPNIAPAAQFEFTDSDYQDFMNFLADKEYDYSSESELLLKSLKEKLQKEKYYASLESDIQTLESKVRHDKAKDLQLNKEEIKRYLKEEIVSRYYFRKGRIESTLRQNPYIKEALRLLKDKAAYNNLLKGQ